MTTLTFRFCSIHDFEARIIYVYRMVIVESRCTKARLSSLGANWLTQKYSEFWLVRYNVLVWSNIAVPFFYHPIYMILALKATFGFSVEMEKCYCRVRKIKQKLYTFHKLKLCRFCSLHSWNSITIFFVEKRP